MMVLFSHLCCPFRKPGAASYSTWSTLGAASRSHLRRRERMAAFYSAFLVVSRMHQVARCLVFPGKHVHWWKHGNTARGAPCWVWLRKGTWVGTECRVDSTTLSVRADRAEDNPGGASGCGTKYRVRTWQVCLPECEPATLARTARTGDGTGRPAKARRQVRIRRERRV